MLSSDLYTYMVCHTYAHTLSLIIIIMIMMMMLIIIIMELLARLGDTHPQSQHTNALDEEVDMLGFKPRTSMS